MKDLDEGTFESWNLQAILDASDKSYWINLCPDILKKASDES